MLLGYTSKASANTPISLTLRQSIPKVINSYLKNFEKYASLYAFLLSIYLEGLVVERHRTTNNCRQLTFDEEWRGVRWVITSFRGQQA